MKHRTLWKDVLKSFKKSLGRFFSITFLMMLGSFALVGLVVTGPDMRSTGGTYFSELNLADIVVMGEYGLDKNDQSILLSLKDEATIEFGYLKDVTIAASGDSFRIYSAPKTVSEYQVVEGRMPELENEIAITNTYSSTYKIGDTIVLDEKADLAGDFVLNNNSFIIVGFVNSSEYISGLNLGASTSGAGELKGFGVVNESVFNSEIYMVARLKYEDTKNDDPYSSQYIQKIQTYRAQIASLLIDRPQDRLADILTQYNNEIQEGEAKLSDAKQQYSDAQQKLADAKSQLEEAKALIEQNEILLKQQVSAGQSQISEAKHTIAAGYQEISEKEALLDQAEIQREQGQTELDANIALYESKLDQYNQSLTEYSLAKEAFDNAQSAVDSQRISLEKQKASCETVIATGNIGTTEYQTCVHYVNVVYPQAVSEILKQQENLDVKKNELDQVKYQLDAAQEELESTKIQLDHAQEELSIAQSQINEGRLQLNQGKTVLRQKEAEIKDAESELSVKQKEGEQQLSQAKEAYSQKENEYIEKNEQFISEKDDIEKQISDAENKLIDAKFIVEHLELPTYLVNTRREAPGSEGYRIYDSISTIIDSLAQVFPFFLYLVAALVTLTTMTRFVDEERVNNGTLKALGYSDRDIIRKFTIYGFVSSLIGSVLGIALGHLIIPLIVNNAYSNGFKLPTIELHFYWQISLISLLLALMSAVVPTYLVAKKELNAKPAQLLLPKPPVQGSKIILERISPLWKRMSFTQKVTARNLFRYKKRMLMTVFGVCGAVALLVTGFGIQSSISGVGEKQFGNILQYDMIVAKNSVLSDKQQTEINTLLNADGISGYLGIRYDELHVFAGNNQDKQTIRMIVSENEQELTNYIHLANRKTQTELEIDDSGVIVSERLATMLNVSAGDTITVNDANNKEIVLKVSGVSEMYIGHFIFMNQSFYEKNFGVDYSENAYLITLVDSSETSTVNFCADFMNLSGIKGVVQNTTLINQNDAIVNSLNKIMIVLIVVAGLLAIVILYNLNNINVSERIRELSTIKVLGFYQNEVTLYIYRETMINSMIGILAGFIFGTFLQQYIIAVVSPDEVMFDPSLSASSYIIPAVIIILVTIMLGYLIQRKLKHLDMLEALKSVE